MSDLFNAPLRTAAAIAAHLDERDGTDQIKVTLCSDACREAVECYIASPPGRFDASRHEGATIRTDTDAGRS
jgi:hypothetical protein